MAREGGLGGKGGMRKEKGGREGRKEGRGVGRTDKDVNWLSCIESGLQSFHPHPSTLVMALYPNLPGLSFNDGSAFSTGLAAAACPEQNTRWGAKGNPSRQIGVSAFCRGD